MQQQIVHEAEVHRQHVRLKIPIGVEIDGTRYTVDDWSLGGFGVTSPITSRQPGERFAVRLIFPFEDFELSLRIDCQMIYRDEDTARFGCRFLALSQGQLTMFRYLVDAYLSGEIVSGGDVLAVLGRENGPEGRIQQQIFDPFLREVTTGRRWRKRLGLGLMLLLGAGLAAAIAFGYQERFVVVTADEAVVEAPVFRLEAASAGTLSAAVDQEQILRPGDQVARIEAPGAPPVPLRSPCECVVHDWVVAPGQVAQVGTLVAVLVAADRPLVVRAELSPERAERLRVGQIAEITLIGRSDVYRGQIDTVDARIQLVDDEDGRQRRVTVVVRPDTPLDFGDLGHLARLRFP